MCIVSRCEATYRANEVSILPLQNGKALVGLVYFLFYGKIKAERGGNMDILSARKLYNDTFGVTEGFDDRLFDLFSHCIRYITEGEQVVSMLFEIPCTLVTEKEEKDACYIYAAATHPDHRGKGYATALVNQTCANNSLVILRPAEDSLVDFYGKLGFIVHTAVDRKDAITPYIKANGELLDLCKDEVPSGEEFCLMFKGDLDQNDKIGFAYSMP